MQVKLLLLENVEADLQNEIQSMLKMNEEDEEERRLRRIIGGDDEDEEPKHLFVNMTKYYKEVDFYFKKTDVSGLFISTLKRESSPIMVIVLMGKEYDCVFNQEIYDELLNYLNS